jgi:hypothetical protein
MITLRKLMTLIALADARQGGCVVDLFAIHDPNDPRNEQPHGTVTYGFESNQRVFHSEAELLAELERIGRPK